MNHLLALLVLLAPALASADSIDAIVRAEIEAQLPAGLAIRTVHVPRALASLDVNREETIVELPREMKAGRASLKVTPPGRATSYVPVTLDEMAEVAIARRAIPAGATITASDIDIVERPRAEAASPAIVVGARARTAIAANHPLTTRDLVLPPPAARGTPVAIEIHRGAVRVRGTGTLELSARVGEPATARLSATKQVVHGVLRDGSTVVVGGPQ